MGIREMLEIEIEAKGLVKPGLRIAFRAWAWTERELPGAMNE